MELWERAKKLGIWNPADLDYSQDPVDWEGLSRPQKGFLLGSVSQFMAGEEAVAVDLLPLLHVMSSEGRIEEELYLTNFLWEEAKHVDFFDGFVGAIGVDSAELEKYHSPAYRRIFYEKLPEAMGRLYADPSPVNLARASATYNMGVEGIMAQSGYHGLFSVLDKEQILPGFRTGLRFVQQDESRHIAYGVFLLSRLVAEDASLFEVVEETTEECLQMQLAAIDEGAREYTHNPFGFPYDDVRDYARKQCRRRIARIAKAKGKTVEEIYGWGASELEESV